MCLLIRKPHLTNVHVVKIDANFNRNVLFFFLYLLKLQPFSKQIYKMYGNWTNEMNFDKKKNRLRTILLSIF